MARQSHSGAAGIQKDSIAVGNHCRGRGADQILLGYLALAAQSKRQFRRPVSGYGPAVGAQQQALFCQVLQIGADSHL